MKINYRSVLLLTGLFSCSLIATAQQETATEKAQLSKKKIDFIIDFTGRENARFAERSDKPEVILGLPEGNNFVQLKQKKDNSGRLHKKYKQTFRGIDIVGGSASMHYSKELELTSLSNEAYIITDINTTPVIEPERARQFAYNYFDVTTFVEDDEVMAKSLGYSKNTPGLKILPIYDNVNPNELVTEFKLAYEVEVYTMGPLNHSLVYVDASNGVILWNRELIFHTGAYAHSSKKENANNIRGSIFSNNNSAAAFVQGVAATRYSGNRNIETTSTSRGFLLRDATRGNGINTYNSGNTSTYPDVDFVDDDNNWTAAEYDNAKKDNGALDAHWGAEVTYDYWKQVHGRDSYDDNGAEIKSWVHFNEVSGSSTGYDNAFWNGTRMTYGDGNRFDVLTALDVVAHEIGHAVCSSTADLAYRNESGALNEGFSDIWGAAIEFYVLQVGSDGTPGNRIWDIGEDLGSALRSMSDPKSKNDPDTYLGTNWRPATPAQGCASPGRTNDRCGVHSNSGVLNHWFYILTVGKTGTNDVGDAYNVNGIGIDKAAKISIMMESRFLTMNSTFADARAAGIRAARELYGTGSAEEIATTNAWYAVNVGGVYSGGGDPTTDTEAPTAPANLIVSDIEDTSVQLTWSAATDNVGVTGYQVWLGNSSRGTVAGLSTPVTGLVKGDTYTFRVRAVDAVGNISGFSNSIEVTTGASTDICAGVPPYEANKSYRVGDLVVYRGFLFERGLFGWTNLGACGSGVNGFAGKKENATAPPFVISTSISAYPNPITNGILNIAVGGSDQRVSYTIVSLLGQVVKHGTIERSLIKMDLSDLTTGIYILQVTVGAERFVQKVNIAK